MNQPSRPDPILHRVAVNHNDWLDTQWQQAHRNEFQAHSSSTLPDDARADAQHPGELNACEMALVILGGVLMFGGFLVPLSMVAGLLCFILALGFSAHKKP